MIVCVGQVRADYLTLSSKLETQIHSFFSEETKGLGIPSQHLFRKESMKEKKVLDWLNGSLEQTYCLKIEGDLLNLGPATPWSCMLNTELTF